MIRAVDGHSNRRIAIPETGFLSPSGQDSDVLPGFLRRLGERASGTY